MKRLAVSAVVVGVAMAGTAVARQELSPESRLAGRVAGPPRQCISSFERDRESILFNDGSVLFQGRGQRLFLNRPSNCPFLKSDRAIANDAVGGQLCRGDIVHVIDPPNPVELGACALGDFIPYDRPGK